MTNPNLDIFPSASEMTSDTVITTAIPRTAQHSRIQLSRSVSLNSPTSIHSSIAYPRSTTPQPLPQTSFPTRRHFNLHIDLPHHVPHHDSLPAHPENRQDITLLHDMRASEATDVRRRRGSTSSKGGWNTFGELGDGFSERVPITPQEQVLRARLERVLSASAVAPSERQNPYTNHRNMDEFRGRERRSHSASRGYPRRGEPSAIAMEASGGLWGWFWRDEDDSEDTESEPDNAEELSGSPSPLSPLSPSSTSRFLPTPQSAGATSSRSGFFDRHSSGSSSNIKQGRITSPPLANRPLSPGRPRSRTQPQPPTSPPLRVVKEMDSPRMLSKAMESLSNHQRRSPSITRSPPPPTTKSSSGSSSYKQTVQSPSRPGDRSPLKVDVEPSRSGRRATLPSQSVYDPGRRRSPSYSPSHPSDRVGCEYDNELLITPPPTPPTDQVESRIPVPAAVTRRAMRNADARQESLGNPVMERERNHRRAKTAQVVEVDTRPTRKTSVPTGTDERERNHRRALSVQVSRQPVRGDELLRFAGEEVHNDGLPLSAPGSPRQYGKTYPQRSPRHSPGRTLAPDPTQFVVVNNPAAASSPPPVPSSPKNSSKFNVQTASAQCRAQEGYVSFAAVEGLGEPEYCEDDEAGQQHEKRRRWLIF